MMEKIRIALYVKRAALQFLDAAAAAENASGQSEYKISDEVKEAGFGIDPDELASIVREHGMKGLKKNGGVDGIAEKVSVSFEEGVRTSDVSTRQKIYGCNRYTEKPPRSFLMFVWEALQDLTLIILMGRMVEIYGQEASGKTTIALHIIKEAQKLGGYCAYLDVENAMDHSLAKSMGVDTENLLISRPDCAENLLSVVNTLTRSGSVDVIVVDSVAALVPQHEIDTVVGGTIEDIQSRLMTQALRKINYSLCQSQTLIVFLNQVRRSLKPGRAEEVTCGGNALKFYSAVRLRMIRTGLLKTEDKVTGLGVCAQVVKNKLAPAMAKAELGIHFGRGFCFESEVLELACEQSLIKKEGRSYVIGREVFSNENAAEQYLTENEGVLDQIVAKLRGKLLQRKM
ncbi:DNA repair protein [Salix suchowensis]|nr:DNA repair protein [Salix suchowensis]